MFIACGIDSESYSTLDVIKGNTLEEVVEKVREFLLNDFIENEITYDNDFHRREQNIKPTLRITATEDYDTGEYFWVYEIFEVKPDMYYLVSWNAYDGVYFDIAEYKSEAEAGFNMYADYSCMVSELDWNDSYIYDNSAVIDDGIRWNCWEIVS